VAATRRSNQDSNDLVKDLDPAYTAATDDTTIEPDMTIAPEVSFIGAKSNPPSFSTRVLLPHASRIDQIQCNLAFHTCLFLVCGDTHFPHLPLPFAFLFVASHVSSV
jgi:hypothetical protein